MNAHEKKEKAQAIAEALNATASSPHDNENYYRIDMVNGVRFSMGVGGYAYKGRIHFSPCYPSAVADARGSTRGVSQRDFDRSLPYNASTFDGITVADTRDAVSIAKAIHSRFLSVYQPLYIQAVEYCESQEKYFSQLKETTARIIEAIKDTGLHASNFGRDYATLEICASPELATAIAQAVRTHRENNK